MNSHLSSEQLALLAGRDLPGSGRAALHLAECPECKERVRAFERAAELLRDFAPEPCEEDLQIVRDSVAAHLILPQTTWLREWRWTWLALVTASLALLFFWPAKRPSEQLHLAQPLMSSLPVVELQRIPLVLPAPVRYRKREAGIRSADLIAKSDGASILKIATADPNVVILVPMGEKNEN